MEIGKKLISGALHVREQQVLQRIADGLTTEEIGVALVLHPKTVRYWSTMARAKLNANSLGHAVAVAMRRELIQ